MFCLNRFRIQMVYAISAAPCSTVRMCTTYNMHPSFVQAALTLPPGSLQWTIGRMYYVSLITAKVFRPLNVSQIVHLFPNANNIYIPGYMIYKNRNPTRLVLFNFNTDPLGFSYYNATFAIGGSGVNQLNASPQQVSVWYFTVPSVMFKGNFQWAGQVHMPMALIASANGNR